ncbi:unnamed protein product [Mytilus coruscus]|uniref:Uncharacterized protein n=1 Tax=Mytilus coruscus TaxID=42192 RepID=A0A6J8AGL1_MYTCO|nr:unnamed protein product [Mytilus coruscus]
MSTEKHESLKFYKYLCQKIGSEEVVRMRRLALCISDMSQYREDRIASGSKGEGLYMKGSDFDIMGNDSTIKVTGLSVDLFALHLSKACWFASYALEYLKRSENKNEYYKNKSDLSLLLIGVHSDAMTGWLKLASFLYGHKNYLASLSVIHYALQKYTDETIFTGFTTSAEFPFVKNPKQYTCTQKHMLNLMKKEKLYTIIKTIEAFIFQTRSLIFPQELRLQVDGMDCYIYHPLPFSYFLGFLCYYHLHDITSYRRYFLKLISTVINSSITASFPTLSAHIMIGIALNVIGLTYFAKQLFQELVDHVPLLSWLSSVINTEMSI